LFGAATTGYIPREKGAGIDNAIEISSAAREARRLRERDVTSSGEFWDEEEHDYVAERWESDVAEMDESDWEEHFASVEDLFDDYDDSDEEADDEDENDDGEDEDEDMFDDESYDLDSALERVAELQRELTELKDEMEEIRLWLGGRLTMGEVVPADIYQVVRLARTRYEFSPEVTELERRLRELKRREIAEGLADVASVVPFVRITRPREQMLAAFPRLGSPWSEAETYQLLELYRAEVGLREIASMLERPVGAVLAKLRHVAFSPQDASAQGASPPPVSLPDPDDDIPF